MNRRVCRRNRVYGTKGSTPGRPEPCHGAYLVPSTSSDGYAFVVLMIALTVMLIGLAAVLPSVYHESQREKEEELIFRGNEYARAIYLFQRQFRRYPNSVDELIRTNNLRFLRHAYKDPMTPNGKWRFIHVGPGGVLLDSLTMGPQQQQFMGAGGQSPGAGIGQGTGFGQGTGIGQGTGFGQGMGFGQGQQQTGSSGQSPPGTGFASDQNAGDSSSQTGAQGQSTSKEHKPRPGCEGGGSDSAFTSGNQTMGLLIAGVASCSDKTSIRVVNKKTKYEEWEFLGVAFQPTGFAGMPQQPVQPAGGPGTQTQGGPQTQPGVQLPAQPGGTAPGGSAPSTPTAPGVQPQQPPDVPLTDQPQPEEPQQPEQPPQPQ